MHVHTAKINRLSLKKSIYCSSVQIINPGAQMQSLDVFIFISFDKMPRGPPSADGGDSSEFEEPRGIALFDHCHVTLREPEGRT